MNISSSAAATLMKALGFDPEEVKAKVEEIEAMGRAFAIDVHAHVSNIDQRLTNIESMNVLILNKLNQMAGETVPAGENSSEFLALLPAPVVVEVEAEGKNGGHHPRHKQPSGRSRRAS